MGGYVADGFQNTVDWIIRKDTEFPGDPPSAPGQRGNIRIRKDILLSPSWRCEINLNCRTKEWFG